MPAFRACRTACSALPFLLGSVACTSSTDGPDGSATDAAVRDAGQDAGATPDAARADAASADAASTDAGLAADGGQVVWYETCGDPVCRPEAPRDAGITACDGEQRRGSRCDAPLAECDPGVGCGVRLRCTDSDPKLRPGGCPISRAAYKLDIRYLEKSDVRRYHDEVIRLGLAHYTYRNDPSAQERLGFIIEDVEPSRFVDEARDRVDLYAYTSAVIAAVKVQEQRIQELEKEVAALRAARRQTR